MASHDSGFEETKGPAEPWTGEKASVDDVQLPKPEDVGALHFDEYTKGGLGRHLGITSTTFLVYDNQKQYYTVMYETRANWL